MNKATHRQNHLAARLITAGICIFLAEAVWISFGSALANGFVNFDDNDYVYDNPNVNRGLTLSGIRWAFTHVHASNWHPLTTISHMADCQLYGLNPWGHHATNILLHATAAVLLFFALRKLTSDIGVSLIRGKQARRQTVDTPTALPAVMDRRYSSWASAFVAALFAVHPLRVESVAWISERKDVLSGVFFMLTLLAYAHYAKSERFFIGRYLTVIALFAAGLLCKPTLVTLPFLLLLLDYWPLRRWQQPGSKALGAESQARGDRKKEQSLRVVSTSQRPNFSTCARRSIIRGLVVEKIPLFVLSFASCLITMIAQKQALNTIRKVAFPERLVNAVTSYVTYLGQTIWPVHLAVLYPYNEHSITISVIIAALLLLLLISTVVWIYRKPCPFLLVGWLWFAGTLVPMIGIVQVGWQPRADRYTYLPQIGLFIAITWGVIELIKKVPHYRQLIAVTGLLIVLSLIVPTRAQTLSWKNSVTLWQHAVDNTPSNYIAYNNLGQALAVEGDLDQAAAAYEQAIQIDSSLEEAEYNLGNVLVQKQNLTNAIAHYQRALRIKPAYPEAEFNLASALFQSGEPYSAIYHYEKAVELKPGSAEMQGRLGSLLARFGRKQEAQMHLTEAVRLRPDYTEAKDELRKLDAGPSP